MNFEDRYGFFDRLLHRFAFGSGFAQLGIAEVEDSLLKQTLTSVDVSRPVFITALPRAGTTIVLELLSQSGLFATHRYGDMPFILCPWFWNRLIGSKKPDQAARERAHGDGIMISLESPEAFEEVLWLQFFRRKYRTDRITPWQTNADAEFLRFFQSHMRKIILLRSSPEEPLRYASKNNANIARIGLLARCFPEAKIVIPLRDPLQHSASLLNQHRRFTQLHQKNPFARRYMAGIGHFDFGLNLKPIDFDQWLPNDWSQQVDTVQFWLEYWVATYRHLSELEAEQVRWLSLELLCHEPEAGLGALAEAVGEDPGGLLAQAERLQPMGSHDIDLRLIPEELLDQARGLFDSLQQRCINR